MKNGRTPTRPFVLHSRCVTGNGGGPEKTIINSPKFLEGMGYHSACAYLHPPDDAGFENLQVRADAAHARLISVPDRGMFDVRSLRQLIQHCQKENVSIWHGHDYKSNALGLVVRRFWPMKLVTTVHGWGVQHTRRTPLYYRIDKHCLRHYDAVICVSQNLYEECLQSGVPATHCRLVYNAIEKKAFTRSRVQFDARRHFSDPNTGRLFGAIGRLSDEKGFDLLIRAVSYLLETGSDLKLWIAGDGPSRSKLKSLIDSLGWGERIRLLGHVDEPKIFFEALDGFVLSSLSEGLPNVLLEAMALELPVLATRIGGVPAVIEHGQNGLLAAPGSTNELITGIQHVLMHEQQAQSMGKAARRTIEKSFGFEERMHKIADIYDGLLSRKRNHAQPTTHLRQPHSLI